MVEIEIHIGQGWDDQEEDLARRIARVVAGDDMSVARQKKGYKWALDMWSNDWFMTGIDGGTVKVVYRGATDNQSVMLALQTFLQWSIGKPRRSQGGTNASSEP